MAEASSTNRWSLQGTTALVTGGTKGLGFAVVEELAELGSTIHTCSRNEAKLNECLKDWANRGFRVSGSVCDVASRAQREKLMEEVSRVFDGKLNILVNNVGTGAAKETVEITAEDFSTMMATNFESAFHLSRLAQPLLKASGCGSIVLMSSVASIVAITPSSLYSATKGSNKPANKELGMRVGKIQYQG